MNRFKNAFILLIFLILSEPCLANAGNVYIQMNGKVQSFEETVINAHGTIKSTNEVSKYLIELNGKNTIIDLSSDKEVSHFMASLFPANIFVKVSFVNVLPNMTAYIDKEKYADMVKHEPDGRLLPVISNQNLNKYVKEIAIMVGIKKRVSMHLARHTFATTITLNRGVDIVSVSKMLGHKNLRTTQIYAKTGMLKIAEDMKKLMQ